ncbi:MAG: hypothetical protein EPO68_00765 [Planctomycetota bacterium]|nr:MAG: hypothetical protein EPO68_00765 [Planctomycetota bacterium]
MSEPSEPDLQLETELRQKLAPHRPDPEAFERRVRERIRERENQPRVETREPSRFVRWAAAVLPPDIGLALLAKQGGFLSTLALPVLVVASGFGAFIAGKRSIEKSARESAPPTAPEPNRWKMAKARSLQRESLIHVLLQFGVLLVIAAPLLFGGARAFDIVALLLAASMGLLAFEVRWLARAGLMRRGSVARMCSGLLCSVYNMCFLWGSAFGLVDPSSNVGPCWSAGLMLAAITLCALAMWHERAASRWNTGLTIGWCLCVFLALTPALSPSSPGYLRRYIRDFAADTRTLQGWRELGFAGEALRAAGEDLPHLAHVRTAVDRAIESGDAAHPGIWTAAARLGLIDDAHWAQLAQRKGERYKLDQILALDGPLRLLDYDEYQLHMLLATRELDAAQREHLARRVAAAWPRTPAHGRLETADMCVRLWSLLCRSDQIEAHGPEARALLDEHWISGEERKLFAKIGGFTSDPAKFRTSFDDTTYAAVDLIAHVGRSNGVDPFLLRGHARSQAERFSLWIASISQLQVSSHAAWLRLEREIGLPQRSWLERVLAERVLLATLLTLLLCVVALRAAPSRAELVRRGLA